MKGRKDLATITALTILVILLRYYFIIQSSFVGFGVDTPGWIIHAETIRSGIYSLDSFPSLAEIILAGLMIFVNPIAAVNFEVILLSSLLGVPIYLLTLNITKNRLFAVFTFLFSTIGIPEFSYMIAFMSLNRFFSLLAIFSVIHITFKIHKLTFSDLNHPHLLKGILPLESILLGISLWAVYLSHPFLLAYFLFAGSFFVLFYALSYIWFDNGKKFTKVLKFVFFGVLISVLPTLPFIPIHFSALRSLAFLSPTNNLSPNRSVGQMLKLLYNLIQYAYEPLEILFLFLFVLCFLVLVINAFHREKGYQKTEKEENQVNFYPLLHLALYIAILPAFFLILWANFSPMYIVISMTVAMVSTFPFLLKELRILLSSLFRLVSSFLIGGEVSKKISFPFKLSPQQCISILLVFSLLFSFSYISIQGYRKKLDVYGRVTSEERRVFGWVRKNTAKSAVFVSNRRFRHWVEAMTGRTSYYPCEPLWYLRRDGATEVERRRGLKLEMALSGDYAVENGLVAVSEGTNSSFLRPLISLNLGEFFEVISVNDTGNYVIFENGKNNFTDLEYHFLGVEKNKGSASLKTRYKSQKISINRTVSLSRASPYVSLQYHFTTHKTTTLNEIQIRFYSVFSDFLEITRQQATTKLPQQLHRWGGKTFSHTINTTSSPTNEEDTPLNQNSKYITYTFTSAEGVTSAEIEINIEFGTPLTIKRSPRTYNSSEIFSELNVDYILVNTRFGMFSTIYTKYLRGDSFFEEVKKEEWDHNIFFRREFR